MDALSRLPIEAIGFLEGGKSTLNTAEETEQVLKQIHQDGHLGDRKTLKMFRRRFVGVREKTLCQAVVQACQGCQLGTDYKPRDRP